VEVRLEGTDAGIRITVSDTGIGIPSEFLPRIFERFAQADSSRTRVQGGLGLGLYLVHSLVEMHSGTIAAQSKGEGQGSLFTIELPAAPLPAPPAATRSYVTADWWGGC